MKWGVHRVFPPLRVRTRSARCRALQNRINACRRQVFRRCNVTSTDYISVHLRYISDYGRRLLQLLHRGIWRLFNRSVRREAQPDGHVYIVLSEKSVYVARRTISLRCKIKSCVATWYRRMDCILLRGPVELDDELDDSFKNRAAKQYYGFFYFLRIL